MWPGVDETHTLSFSIDDFATPTLSISCIAAFFSLIAAERLFAAAAACAASPDCAARNAAIAAVYVIRAEHALRFAAFLAADCGTSTLFTPVAMQAGGIERQPDHLWAPALHAIITHPEARELLHNDDIFSKKGLAGMTAHDWVKSVWPQLGQQRQFEVGSAIRNSSHLIHLLNPPKEWLKQAPEKLLLSREDAMRQQIAQLQALVQMQAAQLRAQNAQQLALPAPVDSPGVLGTRTRDQRDSEGAIDLTSTKRGKAE